MLGKYYIDKYMGSGVILAVSFFLYIVFSFAYYDSSSTIFLFVSAFFILFQAEHLYNFIGRNEQVSLKNVVGTFWHRFVACVVPAIIVATTWWLASGL
ncbi:MAG: hypothetical protein HWE27_14090 [Gammaproteobacteria bacterium]|nr:hypothetical protein [Gammaproteobacteria bacterium]